MARSTLEAQLDEITREFVTRIVATIRGASLAEVAGYRALVNHAGAAGRRVAARRVGAAAAGGLDGIASASAEPKRRGRRPRQSPEKRAELATRILAVLKDASAPMGARAIASEVGIAPDLLAVPLRELRQGGRITKHGDKRATTYSL